MARKSKPKVETVADKISTSLRVPKWRRVLIGGGLGLAGFAVLLIVGFGLFYLTNKDNIFPRVQVGSVKVGGLTKAEATPKIEQALKEYRDKEIVVTVGEKKWSREAADLGFNADAKLVADKAYLIGRDSKTLDNILNVAQLIFVPVSVSVPQAFEDSKVKEFIDSISDEVDHPEQDAGLKIQKTEITETPSQPGKRISQQLAYDLILKNLAHLNQKQIDLEVETSQPKVFEEGLEKAKEQTQLYIDQTLTLAYKENKYNFKRDDIARWIEFEPGKDKVSGGRGVYLEVDLNQDRVKNSFNNIAKDINVSAQDAQLTLKDGKVTVFAPSRDGIEVKQDELAGLVVSALDDKTEDAITIPVKISEAEIKDSRIENLGLKELIGTATTSFVKSPSNRIHNINLGAKYLSGKLIKPGDTFSTISSLGAINEAGGYLPELVIKENKTIPEFGGGLCQVSTTLFRSVLNAGLPIVERQNHSWRISYYEPPVGLDATIYFPKPDFKFKNDTGNWILVQNKVEGTKITFELYGTKDGRRSEIIGPKLISSTSPGEAQYADDPSLPSGTTKQVEKPHPGGVATATYKVYGSDGKIKNEQVFKSIYKAVPAKFLRGTGAASPTQEPAPEPTPAAETTPPATETPAPTSTEPNPTVDTGTPATQATESPAINQ